MKPSPPKALLKSREFALSLVVGRTRPVRVAGRVVNITGRLLDRATDRTELVLLRLEVMLPDPVVLFRLEVMLPGLARRPVRFLLGCLVRLLLRRPARDLDVALVGLILRRLVRGLTMVSALMVAVLLLVDVIDMFILFTLISTVTETTAVSTC